MRATVVRRRIFCEKNTSNPMTLYPYPGTLSHVQHGLHLMKADLEARGILHVWIYGSVARGDQREDSDIDLVIEISPESDMTLTGFARLRLDLRDALGRTVDLAQWHLLADKALDTARRDAVQVF